MKYTCNVDLDILDKLFLKGEAIYITERYYCMDGQFDYARNVYDVDRHYLGRIRDDYFHRYIEHKLTIQN